ILQYAGVEGGRMDLIESESIAEQPPALAQLALQGGAGVVLDLVDLSVDLPFPHVPVPPLGTDYRVGMAASLDPGGHELLSMPIRAGSVEVAHSQSVRRVEHQVGTPAQLVDTSFGGQLSGEVDVRRTTQCGGSEADPTDLEMSAPEDRKSTRLNCSHVKISY